MKHLERIAIFAGLVVVGITAAYRYLLADEQREALREISNVVGDSVQEVVDSVSPLVSDGPTRKEEREANEAAAAESGAQE